MPTRRAASPSRRLSRRPGSASARRGPPPPSTGLPAVLKVAPVGVAIAHDPECRRITLNGYMSELLGVPVGENASLTAPPDQQPGTYANYRDGEEVPPDRLPMQVACTGA